MPQILKRALRPIFFAAYRATLLVLRPVNLCLSWSRRNSKYPDSVLHVSQMVHIPYHTTRILRRHGWKADFLAIGESPTWHKCDFVKSDNWRLDLILREFFLLWSVVSKYEVIHLHFMMTMTATGWELEFLKRMGRRIVVHYRGCEIRDREKNMALHPDINICQRCDYNAVPCTHPTTLYRRALARKYGDHFLVTTPDMKDFVPEAEHFPFFSPEVDEFQPPIKPIANLHAARGFRIVHVTNHPGIEGTSEIQAVVDRLKAKGHDIEFVMLRGVTHERVLEAYRSADLAIGKMKMGYYANAQIESMAMGVPTVTCVRPEFMTPELQQAGFIFTSLPELEATLEHYLTNPEALSAKKRVARERILRLHDNTVLAQRLISLYSKLKNSPTVYGKPQ